MVLVKNANVGDMITPFSSAAGTSGAVVTMADMGTLEVEADVAEANVGKVRIDQPVEITLDALPELRFRGSVARIVPTVDRAKATVMTKVRFEHAGRAHPARDERQGGLPLAAARRRRRPARDGGEPEAPWSSATAASWSSAWPARHVEAGAGDARPHARATRWR